MKFSSCLRPAPLSALGLLVAPSWALASPCIELRGNGPIIAQRTTATEAHAAGDVIDGATISLDSATEQVRFRTGGSADEQKFSSVVLQFGTFESNLSAQSAPPPATPLGHASLVVPLSRVAIVDGVVNYPGCAKVPAGHSVSFKGSLTFDHRRLTIEGDFIDHTPPRPGLVSPRSGASPMSGVSGKGGPP